MTPNETHRAIDQLADRYRERYLWFLRPDDDPQSDEARRRILNQIARHGDREAFVRAAELERWLSRISSAGSAGLARRPGAMRGQRG